MSDQPAKTDSHAAAGGMEASPFVPSNAVETIRSSLATCDDKSDSLSDMSLPPLSDAAEEREPGDWITLEMIEKAQRMVANIMEVEVSAVTDEVLGAYIDKFTNVLFEHARSSVDAVSEKKNRDAVIKWLNGYARDQSKQSEEEMRLNKAKVPKHDSNATGSNLVGLVAGIGGAAEQRPVVADEPSAAFSSSSVITSDDLRFARHSLLREINEYVARIVVIPYDHSTEQNPFSRGFGAHRRRVQESRGILPQQPTSNGNEHGNSTTNNNNNPTQPGSHTSSSSSDSSVFDGPSMLQPLIMQIIESTRLAEAELLSPLPADEEL